MATTPIQLYRLLAKALADYDGSPRKLDEVMVRPQGLFLNTADGKQFRLVAREVLRPDAPEVPA